MRLRLILSFAIIVVVSIVSVVVIASLSTARAIRAYMLPTGMVGIEQLAADLETYYRENGTWNGADTLLMLHRTQGRGRQMGDGRQGGVASMVDQRLRLADDRGVVVVDTSSLEINGILTPLERNQAIELYLNRRLIGYLLPEGGMEIGASAPLNLINRLNRAALAAGLIAGGFSLILAIIFAYTLLRPIHALTQGAKNLASGNLAERVQVSGSDELALLGTAFNHMASSLQQAEESRRAMTADIAHELRTPLAVQRAQLEAILDGVYPLDQGSMESVLSQNILLTRLVDDLRTLALADAGRLELSLAPVDLFTLVKGIAERFTPKAAAVQVNLVVDSPAAPIPPMLLDPARIEQIISNLLTNALRYTPPGTNVTLNLIQQPGEIHVTIKDSGPGIPAHALPHLFERFYRADDARSRIDGGSGLGLTIARQLAQAHGGDLQVANHPQGGAVFTLILPTMN